MSCRGIIIASMRFISIDFQTNFSHVNERNLKEFVSKARTVLQSFAPTQRIWALFKRAVMFELSELTHHLRPPGMNDSDGGDKAVLEYATFLYIVENFEFFETVCKRVRYCFNEF